MRSPIRPGGLAVRLFALLVLILSLEASAIGFESGEVHANAVNATEGMTVSAAEVINMSAVSPPVTNPPLPSSYAPAQSTLNGTMSSFKLTSQGSIDGALRQLFSEGRTQVDFVDNLIVNTPAVPIGTDLIVEVTWLVSGRAEFDATSTITSRAKVLLDAEGIVLDPNAPPPPRQQWIHDRSNFTPDHLDNFGLVRFEYLVEAGTAVFDGNIRMRSVAGFICGGPGSEYVGSYDASANTELNVTFVGATDVKTTDGRTLYQWTTNAQSGLSYGSRDDDPPSDPVLTVAPSPAGEKFVRLSWDTVPTEFYIVQATVDGTHWSNVTEVLGNGETVNLDIIEEQPDATYRLLTDFGTGNPTAAPLRPEPCVLRHDADTVRVAWPTNHWESYILNEIDAGGNKTQVETAEGTGGAVWFDFPTNAQTRLFQIEATLK